MKKIDACGLSCPQPVMLTMNEMKNGENDIEILVDSMTCVENIKRCANNNKYNIEVISQDDNFLLKLTKDKL